MSDLFTFFLIVLKASLFSTGGLGNLPSIHSDLITRNWASENQFAESIAVGQIAPGPNGLWVVSLGYLVGGVGGSLAALAAIVLPPFLILLVQKAYMRVQHHPFVEGFVRGLSLAVVGVFLVVLAGLLQKGSGGTTSSSGINGRSLLIAVASFGLGATKRVPVALVIALAAVVGMVWK